MTQVMTVIICGPQHLYCNVFVDPKPQVSLRANLWFPYVSLERLVGFLSVSKKSIEELMVTVMV